MQLNIDSTICEYFWLVQYRLYDTILFKSDKIWLISTIFYKFGVKTERMLDHMSWGN